MNKILIVGGSKGIGRSILETQLESRACINLSRNKPDIQHDQLTHHGVDVMHDDLPEVESINTIVYCPGTITLKPFSALTTEDFQHDFNINVVGAVKVIRQYLPLLKKADHASIILFSTVAVQQGMAFHSSIAAAKAGVEGLVRSLAAELAPRIRVNGIAPTITDTELAKSVLKNEKTRANLTNRHPLKMILAPQDIADMANYLISDKARAISGQIFHVDAGMSSLR